MMLATARAINIGIARRQWETTIEKCILTGQENEIKDAISIEQFEETPSFSAMRLSASPPCSPNHQNGYSYKDSYQIQTVLSAGVVRLVEEFFTYSPD